MTAEYTLFSSDYRTLVKIGHMALKQVSIPKIIEIIQCMRYDSKGMKLKIQKKSGLSPNIWKLNKKTSK